MAPDNLFDSLLAQSRGLVTERLSAALAAMMEQADQSLVDSLEQPAALAGAFRARYLTEFARRCDRARNIHAELSDTDASLELALVGEEDLNETLRFSEMATRLRRYCDEELAALDQRAGVLLGDANLQAEANPFSPQAICEAYKEACRQVADGAAARGALLKLFDDHVVDELRSMYKAVNALLVEQGILPKIRYSVRAQREKDKAEAAPAQDFFAVLQNLLPAKGAGPGAGAGGGPLVQGPELLSALSGLQLQFESGEAGMVNRLRELKATSLGASMGQMDAMTLDIVTMLFDQLFDDPKIPLGAKALIGRLQMPVLKAAIADKALFSNNEHPARRLLDTLGEIAARLPADFNTTSPLFSQLEAIVQDLIGGEAEAALFDSVRERCVALMAAEDARVERETRARAEAILREEALALAKGVAEEQVRSRVQASPLPGVVLEFLVEHWLKLLLIIHVKRGAESEPWKTALEAMDQLIWSVQPKTAVEERRALAAAVPGLLKRLAAGLHVIGAGDAVREAFFDGLMTIHTQVLAGSAQTASAPDRASQLAGFSSSIVVRNPFGGGEVNVDGLDSAMMNGAPPSLKVGIWAELREREKRQPARLVFISPKKTRYFFVDRTGKNYIEYSRAEISRRLRSGELTVMDEVPEVPLFERIMRNVVGKMRGAAA